MEERRATGLTSETIHDLKNDTLPPAKQLNNPMASF